LVQISGLIRIIVTQSIIGVGLGILTIIVSLIGMVGVWREIDYFLVGVCTTIAYNAAVILARSEDNNRLVVLQHNVACCLLAW
jgi:ABC-type lipoprotein release transport system permease subunit